MARRSTEDDSSEARTTNRRAFTKTVGLAATAAAGTAIVGSPGSAATAIDLGEKGLSNGDTIDQYLEEHFTDGNEVHIPAGEYEYTGAGIGGEKANCALVGSPEGVTFNRPDTDTVIRPTLWATSGTVRIENITIKGKRGEEQSRWRVGAAEGATVDVVNVNMPDGTVDGSDSTGIYAGTDHAGTLKVRHCYFSDFGNVACHVSDPYVEGNGKVVVEDCDFVNTGMSALRLAPDKSEVRRCYFEATEKAAASHVGWNQRGIKIDDAGTGVVVEDCDFLWDDPGRTAVKFDDKGEGGAGVMRNLRIQNDGDDPTFAQDWSVGDNWTGENINLSGSGTHNAPSSFETVTGSDATEPNTESKIWTPQGSQNNSDSGSTTETATDTANETATATAAAAVTATTTGTATEATSDEDSAASTTSFDEVLVIDGSGDAEETARYTFSVSGDAEWNEEHSEVNGCGTASDSTGDTVTDGRVVGVVGNAVDAYSISGTVTDIDIRGNATFTIIRS